MSQNPSTLSLSAAKAIERLNKLARNRTAHVLGIERLLDEQVAPAVTSNMRAAGGAEMVWDSVMHLLNEIPAGYNPASISGFVYADDNNNGIRDSGEHGLAGITIEVIPVDTVEPRQTVTVTTDESGYYEALNLFPGTYRVVQPVQPDGYLDGLDTAGTVNGEGRGMAVNPGDNIEDIFLAGGEDGVEYNFGELLPGSIQGVVYADMNRNCHFDAGEDPSANVKIELLDANGVVIATTHANEEGAHEFRGLIPGVHAVRETQPSGYFHGGQSAGSHGGDDSIVQIPLRPGNSSVENNFSEVMVTRKIIPPIPPRPDPHVSTSLITSSGSDSPAMCPLLVIGTVTEGISPPSIAMLANAVLSPT